MRLPRNSTTYASANVNTASLPRKNCHSMLQNAGESSLSTASFMPLRITSHVITSPATMIGAADRQAAALRRRP